MNIRYPIYEGVYRILTLNPDTPCGSVYCLALKSKVLWLVAFVFY